MSLISQPPIQIVGGFSSCGGEAAGEVKLTTHLHLMPMLGISGAVPKLHRMRSVACTGTSPLMRQGIHHGFVIPSQGFKMK